MLQRLARVVAVLTKADDCLQGEYWRDEASEALVATIKVDATQHCLEALAQTAAMVISPATTASGAREVCYLVDPEGFAYGWY